MNYREYIEKRFSEIYAIRKADETGKQRNLCVPIESPCTPIERPCVAIERPCSPIERPCVPIDSPCYPSGLSSQICPLIRRKMKALFERNLSDNNSSAAKQENSSTGVTFAKVLIAIGGAKEFVTNCMTDGLVKFKVIPNKIFYWDQTNEVIKYIIKDIPEASPIVLVGHSYGGDTAINVANGLKDAVPEEKILCLMTVDPVSWSGYFSVSKPVCKGMD